MDKDWIEERHRINAILGNDKPSILESFTVLPYDFSYETEHGRLNFGYIDEKLVLDISSKYKMDFILSILTRKIGIDIKNLLSDRPAYNQQVTVEIKKIIYEAFRSLGPQQYDDLMEFLNTLREQLYRKEYLIKKNLI